MKIIILILTLAFTAPAFADNISTDTWVKVTNDFEIAEIIDANPIWSDTVAAVLGGSGGGGTTGGMMPLSNLLGTSGSGGLTGIKVYQVNNNTDYLSLIKKGLIPYAPENGFVFKTNTKNNSTQYGILVDNLWLLKE